MSVATSWRIVVTTLGACLAAAGCAGECPTGSARFQPETEELCIGFDDMNQCILADGQACQDFRLRCDESYCDLSLVELPDGQEFEAPGDSGWGTGYYYCISDERLYRWRDANCPGCRLRFINEPYPPRASVLCAAAS